MRDITKTVSALISRDKIYNQPVLYIFIIIIPLITMKLISEERKMRTDQLILTSPVSLFGIVFAKFLAAFTLFGGTFIISSVIYYIPLSLYGTPNAASYICSVIAILLSGSAFIAIGIFISSLTENQFIAALGTIAAIILLLTITELPSEIDPISLIVPLTLNSPVCVIEISGFVLPF